MLLSSEISDQTNKALRENDYIFKVSQCGRYTSLNSHFILSLFIITDEIPVITINLQ